MQQPVIHPLPRSPSPVPPTFPPPLQQHIRLPSSPDTGSPASPVTPAFGIKSQSKDVPWRMLCPIILFRIADAASYTFVFPIITDMVTSFDVPQDQIGFYAGLGEGILMLVEAMLATTWAKLADRFGRKPCLVWGQALAMFAAGMMGFSTKVWQVIFWRAALGMGSAGVINKIMAGEVANPQNRSKIFSYFSPSFSIGNLIGAGLGGQLAHPYGRLPSWMGGTSEFWRRWPFALPSVAIAVLGYISIIVGQIYLIETRPPVKRDDELGHVQEKARRKGALKATWHVPDFALVTFIFCCFQLTNFAFDGVFTVYTYTSVELGGLGLPVTTIGFLYNFGSLVYCIIVPTLLPRLEARLGVITLLRTVFATWLFIGLMIPVTQYLAIHMRPAMWVVLFANQALKCFGAFAWPMCDCLSMATFDDFPELMAAGSAISLIAGAVGRAIGPAMSGWLFSISTLYPTGSLGRQISWTAVLSIAILPLVFVNFLRDPKKDGGGYEAVPLTMASPEAPYGKNEESDDDYDDDDDDMVQGQSGAVGRDFDENEDLHKRRGGMV